MRLFFLCWLAIGVWACGNEAGTSGEGAGNANVDNELQSLYQQAMEAHDEVMPLYNDISRTESTLTKYMRENKSSDDIRTIIITTNLMMDKANDAMMEWMGRMSNTPEKMLAAGSTEEEVKSFWTQMLDDIKFIEEKMSESLTEGQRIVERLELSASGNQ